MQVAVQFIGEERELDGVISRKEEGGCGGADSFKLGQCCNCFGVVVVVGFVNCEC